MTYPFKDGSSLLSSGRGALANDVFLDLQFWTSDLRVKRVALTSLRTSTGGYGPEIAITFSFFLQDPVTGNWSTLTRSVSRSSYDLVSYSVFSADWGAYKAKIVPGPGMLQLFNTPLGAWAYPASLSGMTAEVTPSVVLPAAPAVTSIHFKNVTSSNDVLAVTPSGNVTMQAGNNVEFRELPGAIGFNVVKGAGAGLYDTCVSGPTDEVRSINGIAGTNFVFTADNCHKTLVHAGLGLADPDHKAPGLEFEHVCRPKCTSEEVNGFAYYSNRIQDAVNKLSVLIKSVIDSLKVDIAAKEALVQSQVVSPYIDAQVAVSLFNNRKYASLGVGIYDPNKKKMTTTLAAYFSGGIATKSYLDAHPSWTGWVYHPSSAKLDEDNVVHTLPATVPDTLDKVSLFTDRGLDCRGSAMSYFTAHAPSGLMDQWVKLVLSVYENSVVTATAFKYLTVEPTARPYMDVKSRRGLRKVGNVTTYVYTVTVELFNANPSWSGTTAFSAVVNSGHKLSQPKLRINSGTPETLGGSNSTTTFTGKTVTYPARAVVTFQLESNSSSPVSLSLTQTVGSQTSTLSSLTFS